MPSWKIPKTMIRKTEMVKPDGNVKMTRLRKNIYLGSAISYDLDHVYRKGEKE